MANIEQEALRALERLRIAASKLNKDSPHRNLLVSTAHLVDGVIHNAANWSQEDLDAIRAVCNGAEVIATVDTFLQRAHELFDEAVENARRLLDP